MTVFHVGVKGEGLVTVQPAALVRSHGRGLANGIVGEEAIPWTVPRLWQADEHGVEARLVQGHVQLLALIVRDERVRASVQDHHWWIRGSDIAQRVEAFNITNAVQWPGPSTNVTATAFGTVAETQSNDPRFVQIVFRLLW